MFLARMLKYGQRIFVLFLAQKKTPCKGALLQMFVRIFFYYFLRLYAAIARARAPNSAAIVAGSGTRAMLKPSALS